MRFRLGVIEESLKGLDALETLKPFFFSQRIEERPEDPSPIWHVNEYHLSDAELVSLLPLLEQQLKPTWYIHAFNDEKLIVILPKKSFIISLRRDETWEEMIAYGESQGVEKHFLENIPLDV